MVTATIYSSAGTKIIDIGDTGLQPWLQETTYLMDQLGRTTATIAQTVSPTWQSGTGPFATPFVTGPAPILDTTTTVPSSTITTPPNPPSLSLSNSTVSGSNVVTTGAGIPPATATAKSPMLNTILGVAIGVLVGLLIGVAYYFYRRRNQKRKARKESGSSGSEDNWSDNTSPPPIDYEKVMSVSRAMGRIKAVFDTKGQDDTDEGWSQRWPQDMSERPKQSQNELKIRVSHDEYTGTPPPPFDADDPTRPPAAAPVSILKQPPVEPRTTLIETAHTLLKRAPTYEPIYAEKKPPVRNKGVRFGPDEVREFGLTSVASREPSLDGSDANSDGWSVEATLSLGSGSSNMSDREMEGEVLKMAAAERSRR